MENLKVLANNLARSNKTCKELYKKYKALFKNYKDSYPGITATTSTIVHNINEIIKSIVYLYQNLKIIIDD